VQKKREESLTAIILGNMVTTLCFTGRADTYLKSWQ